ncbi:MAG: hypothetical protein ABWY66_17695 [Xanthobacteraceae bacterium]
MDRLRKSLILLAVIAVPAAAHSTFAPEDELCFASGSATFKLSQKASSPDIRVKIDNAAAAKALLSLAHNLSENRSPLFRIMR